MTFASRSHPEPEEQGRPVPESLRELVDALEALVERVDGARETTQADRATLMLVRLRIAEIKQRHGWSRER